MNKSAILLVNDGGARRLALPTAANYSRIRKISTKKSWVIWSGTFDRDQFLTLNTASGLACSGNLLFTDVLKCRLYMRILWEHLTTNSVIAEPEFMEV
jgi:hypothetical protein